MELATDKVFVAGIDVGANGCLCLLEVNTDAILFVDFAKSTLSLENNFLVKYRPVFTAIEKVHSMPKQGVASTFSFGQRFGEQIGLITANQLINVLVSPQSWHGYIGIDKKATKHDIAKFISKIYPNAELSGARGGLLDGRSDSLCIAHYAKLRYQAELDNIRSKIYWSENKND